jgi:hypothetical protein
MKTFDVTRLLRSLFVLGALSTLFGCSEDPKSILLTNRLPDVRLTSAPIDTTGTYYYSITLNWVGFDADGRVDHYLYAIDTHLLQPGADTTWVRTEDNEVRLTFPSTKPVVEPGDRRVGRDFHTFVIKAVDDRGEAGPFTYRAFNSYTVSPTVRLTGPGPSTFLVFVTPSVRMNWSGEDPDGVFTQKPVKYKYILLSNSSEFPMDEAFSNPDKLRKYYENHPLGPWAGWDSTSAETTQVQFTNLTPQSEYVFAVVAFDEAGAYSSFFDLTTNMVKMRVTFAGVGGPIITMFNEFFNYTYSGGGYCVCEKAQVGVEVPANRKITINWFATTSPGADIANYRWTLDIENVFDDTPRTNELTDLSHWSTPSANVTSATVGPFRGGEIHFFYIEAEDNNGLKSLGIIRFEVVEPSFARNLLVVDDTRLKVDVRAVGQNCTQLPSGPWPTRAEMDTFLFARGGMPWRCYPNTPPTTPGLFAGYDFDTLGTRSGRDILTVKLSVLGQYRHIVWMSDGAAATNNKPGTDLIDPEAALRFMGRPGRVNTLATFVRQGGKVWLSGGGAAQAASLGFNNTSNDQPTKRWSVESLTPLMELGPGRFMYDIAKWQGQFRGVRTNATIYRARGRFEGTPTHSELPIALSPKTVATDPIATEAPGRQSSSFHTASVDIEFLEGAINNFVIEDMDPDPDVTVMASTLDTLYGARGPVILDNRPEDWYVENGLLRPGRRQDPEYVVMTYYHGPPPDLQTFVMSGFPIWWPQRTQAQALVDHVLQRLWNMPKGVAGVSAHRAEPPAFRARFAVATPMPGQKPRAVPIGVAKSPTLRSPQD